MGVEKRMRKRASKGCWRVMERIQEEIGKIEANQSRLNPPEWDSGVNSGIGFSQGVPPVR